jgi:hypothetical protein
MTLNNRYEKIADKFLRAFDRHPAQEIFRAETELVQSTRRRSRNPKPTTMPQFIPRRPRSQLKRKGHPATGQPFLQGRIVPTEASVSVKTFCRNLMSPKTGVSSDFYEINAFVLFNLQTEPT